MYFAKRARKTIASYCERCPVRADCLMTSILLGETTAGVGGVWGGFNWGGDVRRRKGAQVEKANELLMELIG